MVDTIKQKFIDWWRTRDDVDKCERIKNKAIEVNNAHKKMVKASKREAEYNGSRTGIRGGTFTTITVNAQRATESYLNSLEELKYMVKTT